MADHGTLSVYAYTSDARIPVADANVTVTKDLQPGSPILAEAVTDPDGYIPPVRLDAPPLSESDSPGQKTPFATVAITIRHPRYRTESADDVQIFPGTETIQGFRMIPIRTPGRDMEPYATPQQNL